MDLQLVKYTILIPGQSAKWLPLPELLRPVTEMVNVEVDKVF